MTSTSDRSPTPPPSENTSLEELTSQRLAALTGFDDPTIRHPGVPPSSRIDHDTGTSDMTDEEIEAELTRHTFASHPVSKIVVVFSGVLVVVLLGGFFIQTLTGSRMTRKKTPAEHGFTQQVAQAKTGDREKAELLTELALKDQEAQLKALGRQQPQQKPKPKPVPKVATRSVQTYQPPIVSQPPRIVRQVIRVPAQQPKGIQEVQQDPYTQWVAASKLGSYGRTTAPVVAPGTPQATKEASATIAGRSATTVESVPSPTVFSPKDILVGTSAKAITVTPIAFTDHTEEKDSQNVYIIRLTEPFLSADGTPVLPEGTQILARLVPGNAPLVTLSAEAILMQQNRQWIQYLLPEDAVSVGSQDEKPLMAKEKRVNNRRRDRDELGTVLDALGSAGSALDIPGGNVPSQIYRRARTGRSLSYTGRASLVYYLPANTKVRVVVNQSFSPFNNSLQPSVQSSQLNEGVSVPNPPPTSLPAIPSPTGNILMPYRVPSSAKPSQEPLRAGPSATRY